MHRIRTERCHDKTFLIKGDARDENTRIILNAGDSVAQCRAALHARVLHSLRYDAYGVIGSSGTREFRNCTKLFLKDR